MLGGTNHHWLQHLPRNRGKRNCSVLRWANLSHSQRTYRAAVQRMLYETTEEEKRKINR